MNKHMFAGIVTIAILSACSTHSTIELTKFDSVPQPQIVNQDKFYNVIFLKVTDEQGYAEYRKFNESVFANAGCHIERELHLEGASKGTLDVGDPNRAIITYCDTANAFAALGKDEAYLKIKPLMLQSASGFSFASGKSAYAETSGSHVKDRLYVIKISRFNDKHHQVELQRIKTILSSYGFHAENIITISNTHGLKSFSEIAIFYFDQPALQEELYQDKVAMKALAGFNKAYTDGFAFLEGKDIKM